jgi:hypothetical protein
MCSGKFADRDGDDIHDSSEGGRSTFLLRIIRFALPATTKLMSFFGIGFIRFIATERAKRVVSVLQHSIVLFPGFRYTLMRVRQGIRS